ncbi:MAG: hypothetical protein U5J95_02895 [Balneolaceae bacterium]|nr:hypothetical protein [Balneolaceae bacterium]
MDGSTVAYTEDAQKRFESYNWHVQNIDGHDRAGVEQAITEAQKVGDQPSIIICQTHIGFGSPNKQDSASSHGSPLGEEEIKLTKENLGWDTDAKFFLTMSFLISEKLQEVGKENYYEDGRLR